MFEMIFTARCYASAVYAVILCPSVRPSVCHTPYSTKRAKPRITQTAPYDSPGTCFLIPKMSVKKCRWNSHGVTLNGDFQPLCCYISEMVQDWDIVTMEWNANELYTYSKWELLFHLQLHTVQ